MFKGLEKSTTEELKESMRTLSHNIENIQKETL